MFKEDSFKSMKDIEIIHKNLGSGYTSTVSLVRHSKSKKKYALKTVNITQIYQ